MNTSQLPEKKTDPCPVKGFHTHHIRAPRDPYCIHCGTRLSDCLSDDETYNCFGVIVTVNEALKA